MLGHFWVDAQEASFHVSYPPPVEPAPSSLKKSTKTTCGYQLKKQKHTAKSTMTLFTSSDWLEPTNGFNTVY